MNKPKHHFDPTFILGLVIAAVCILGGLILEKGEVKDITQVTAGLIVFGGTIGAVVVSTPKATLISAMKRAPSVLRGSTLDASQTIEQLVSFSHLARRSGTKALESAAEEIQDRFFKRAMGLVADGFTASEIRLLLETEIDMMEHHADADAKVFDAAGGYAPTIGIIGAVLGLIQVMKHLDQMQEVGRGIAVAFVATVYGVAIANLVFLPMGSKIRARVKGDAKLYEMVLEGVVAIQEGLNPRLLRQLLEPFARLSGSPKTSPEGEGNPAVAYTDTRKAS
jgi:chemotaxis protein MotA